MSTDARADLGQRIEAVESGYEFMLAYAAQGRDTDKGAAAGRNVREYLEKMAAALDGLGGIVADRARAVDPALPSVASSFLAALDSDARIAHGAVRLVLARPDISSQLIDNLNASIHLRALLTDRPPIDLADPDWVIHTQSADRPPVRFEPGCRVAGSMVANGCTIGGEVVRSVLFPGVIVPRGAVVRDSIVMGDSIIQRGAVVDRAILDKLVEVGEGARVGDGDDSTPNVAWTSTPRARSWEPR